MKKNCIICQKEFIAKGVRRKKTAKYCSWKCMSLDYRKRLKGKRNSNWKGGKTIRTDGYIYIYSPNHPFAHRKRYVMEHRLVMEKWLRKNDPKNEALIEINGGKYLRPKYLVHHINHDRKDNKRENLMLMSKGSHQSYHQKGKKFSENHKRKISQAHLGMKKPWVSNLMKEKRFSSEKKEKMGIARKEYWKKIKQQEKQSK